MNRYHTLDGGAAVNAHARQRGDPFSAAPAALLTSKRVAELSTIVLAAANHGLRHTNDALPNVARVVDGGGRKAVHSFGRQVVLEAKVPHHLNSSQHGCKSQRQHALGWPQKQTRTAERSMLQNARPSRSSSTLGAISFISISLNAHSLVLSQPTRPSWHSHGTHTHTRARADVPNEDGQQVKECADEGEHSERDNGSAQGLQLLQRAIALLVDKHSPPLADQTVTATALNDPARTCSRAWLASPKAMAAPRGAHGESTAHKHASKRTRRTYQQR